MLQSETMCVSIVWVYSISDVKVVILIPKPNQIIMLTANTDCDFTKLYLSSHFLTLI
jgi:hypothetical protein